RALAASVGRSYRRSVSPSSPERWSRREVLRLHRAADRELGRSARDVLGDSGRGGRGDLRGLAGGDGESLRARRAPLALVGVDQLCEGIKRLTQDRRAGNRRIDRARGRGAPVLRGRG